MCESQKPQEYVPVEYTFTGTVVVYEAFDPEKDAEALRGAMKGLGTDEETIIKIVSARTNSQRLKIKEVYKKKYGRDIQENLENELRGNFEDVMVALFFSPLDYDVYCMHRALCKVGTDEAALIEILCTRSKEEIENIKAAYKEKYCKDLKKVIEDDTHGHFKRMLVILLEACRDTSTCIDLELARCDAQKLIEAGVEKCGTDEAIFNEIFCRRSFRQLRATFFYYNLKCEKTLIESLDSEFSGDLKMGLKAIVGIADYPPRYFAKRLYKAMKGAGTDDSTLIRIVVSRCEVDMSEIKAEYQKLTDKTLHHAVKHDTSGDYREILLELIDE